MSMAARAAALGCKVETTLGTVNAPSSSADVFPVYELDFNAMKDSSSWERAPIAGTFSMQTPVPGLMAGGFTCKVPLAGSGTAGTAPTYGPLLVACGLTHTVVAATSVTWKHTTLYSTAAYASTTSRTGMGGVSAYKWSSDTAGAASGKLYKCIGTMGNAKLVCKVGDPPMWEFDMKGVYSAPSVTSFPSFTVTEDAIPLPFVGAGMTFTPSGGAAHTSVVRSVEYDFGNQVEMRTDANGTSGYISAMVVNRKPKIKMTIEEPSSYTPASGQNWWTNFSGSVTGDLEIGTVGSTAGNRWAIDWPKVGFNMVTMKEDAGIVCLDIEMTPATSAISTGDDEFVLTFT